MRSFYLRLLFAVFAALPLRLLHAVGGALGWLLYVFQNKRRRTAEINLELCFPEMRPQARRRLLRRNLIETGKTVTEIGKLWTLDKDRLRTLVHTTGEAELRAKIKQGKGLILATVHLGAWEVVGLYSATHYPVTALYRVRNSPMNDFMSQARERFGGHMVPMSKAGIRAMYQALGRGEMIWIMPDQVPDRRAGSVFAPFFGIPASTIVLLSRLAASTGAPVVFAYAERLAHGRGYKLHYLPAPDAINNDDVEVSATAINAMVEKCAREKPEQYQWIYKRFRVRPPGAKPFY